MTGVPGRTALSFFDFFGAKTDGNAKARTSAAANAASFPFFRCRVIFIKRRGDSRARRKATRRRAASPPCICSRGNGEILAGGREKGERGKAGDAGAAQLRMRARRASLIRERRYGPCESAYAFPLYPFPFPFLTARPCPTCARHH